MRTPLWEVSPGALAALLNSGAPLNKCDLYTVTLPSGSVLRWTSADGPMLVNGQSYQVGPGIERSRCKWSIGVNVDNLTLTLTTDAARPCSIGGKPLLAYIAARGFGRARVQLDRAFWGAGDAGPVGVLQWFIGRVAEVPDVDRYSVQLTVKSELSLLNIMVPREVFQSQCLRTVYDSECTVNRASFTVTGGITTTGGSILLATDLNNATGYFDLGTITFTSGANNGLSRTVKTHTRLGSSNSTLAILSPLPVVVSSGDTFTIVPGCDGLQATCSSKFSNLIHFKGQPYVPQPETVT